MKVSIINSVIVVGAISLYLFYNGIYPEKEPNQLQVNSGSVDLNFVENIIPEYSKSSQNENAYIQTSSKTRPTAGVSIEYQLPQSITSGQVAEIKFKMRSSNNLGILVVTAQAEGLEIINPNEIQPFDLEHSLEHEFSLSVYSGENRRAYINLFITVSSGTEDINQQVYSIPVQFGNPKSQTLSSESPSNNTNRFIRSMPAQETITIP